LDRKRSMKYHLQRVTSGSTSSTGNTEGEKKQQTSRNLIRDKADYSRSPNFATESLEKRRFSREKPNHAFFSQACRKPVNLGASRDFLDWTRIYYVADTDFLQARHLDSPLTLDRRRLTASEIVSFLLLCA